MRKLTLSVLTALLALSPLPGLAHDVTAKPDPKVPAAFDVVRATATHGRTARDLHHGGAGQGRIAEAEEGRQAPRLQGGCLCLADQARSIRRWLYQGLRHPRAAITAHPDFDDTPLFDENGDGDPDNDGADWHSHWVVLVEDKACTGGLKVRDVSPGQDVLPATAPGLPIALDSPGMSPLIKGAAVRITVPVQGAENINFDAVAAKLQVHEQGKAPLLCVTGTYKVASGNLSLPGVITRKSK